MKINRNIFPYILLTVFVVINLLLAFGISNTQVSDAHLYDTLAKEVAKLKEWYPHKHNLFSVYIVPSLYINILGSLYSIFGCSALVGKLLNIILTVFQFFAIKKILDLLFPNRKGLASYLSLIFFMYPNIYFTNLLTLTETVFNTFLFYSFLFFVKSAVKKDKSFSDFILCGLFTAFAFLVRPVILLTLFLMVGFYLYKRIRLKFILVFIIFMLIPAGLHGINVKRKLGVFNVCGTTGGVNLFLGHNPDATGRYSTQTMEHNRILLDICENKNLSTFEKNKLLEKYVIRYIIEHPKITLIRSIKKIIYLFIYDGKQIEMAFNKRQAIEKVTAGQIWKKFTQGGLSFIILINQVIYGCFLCLILIGIYYLIKHSEFEKLFLVIVYPFSIFALTIMVVSGSRYHFPIILSSYPLIVLGIYYFLTSRKHNTH